MMKPTKTIDSHAWTGEEDYVEVEALPVAMLLLSTAMLMVAILI